MSVSICLPDLLRSNSYPGRGIVLGLSPDGAKSMVAYFIMGRSENSRNRIFSQTDDGIRTEVFDASKLADPSLIIYHPARAVGDDFVVTNGDQTDTIRDFLLRGEGFRCALQTRAFEPDAPHFTSRISGIVHPDGSYSLSILKSADPVGSACNRFFFDYEPLPGTGHFISTYRCDGDPIPAFSGEPVQVEIPDDAASFAHALWEGLHPENKVSLFVRACPLSGGAAEEIIINRNQGGKA